MQVIEIGRIAHPQGRGTRSYRLTQRFQGLIRVTEMVVDDRATELDIRVFWGNCQSFVQRCNRLLLLVQHGQVRGPIRQSESVARVDSQGFVRKAESLEIRIKSLVSFAR